jgi:hypothetical protein
MKNAANPWRVITWSDENGREVMELAFHKSELERALNYPFPRGAVAREPVTALTTPLRARPYQWLEKVPEWVAKRTQHRDGRVTISGPRGVTVALDPKRYFPDDPGADTPAMVYYAGGGSTYWCAADQGEVDRGDCEIRLPDEVCEWLHSAAGPMVEQFFRELNEARKAEALDAS